MTKDAAMITAFFDRWAQEPGLKAQRMASIMEMYGGFGNLTIAQENDAMEDIAKQCVSRGLIVLKCGAELITKKP